MRAQGEIVRDEFGTVLEVRPGILSEAPSLRGRKDDAGKPRWDLLLLSLRRGTGAVVDVLTHGARRYSADNWRRVEHPRRRYVAATMRHIAAWLDGEELDADSGEHHLSHAICSLLFLLELDLERAEARADIRSAVEALRQEGGAQ